MQHIFEPFFSRKKMGPTSGSGLGLTVVWNTAQDHEGAVFVERNHPGTTFRIYFPATRDHFTTHPVAGKLKDLYGHGERLLIVDDDEQQQIICSQILKSLGYSVNVVASGEEALEYLKTHTVDLLILDMILGQGMNGRQTYDGVKKMLPGLKAIIVSGFSADTEVKKTQRLGAGRFVKKPYTINQIGMAIKETLTSS
jgi:CheY-like chemotaxis protein